MRDEAQEYDAQNDGPEDGAVEHGQVMTVVDAVEIGAFPRIGGAGQLATVVAPVLFDAGAGLGDVRVTAEHLYGYS